MVHKQVVRSMVLTNQHTTDTWDKRYYNIVVAIAVAESKKQLEHQVSHRSLTVLKIHQDWLAPEEFEIAETLVIINFLPFFLICSRVNL